MNVATKTPEPDASEFEFEPEFEPGSETEPKSEFASFASFEDVSTSSAVVFFRVLLVIASHAVPRKAFPLHLSLGGRAAANASFSDASAALATPAASTTIRTSSTLETAKP